MTEEIRDWYFTFDYSHQHGRRFVRIVGTYQSAKNEMIRRFGSNWARQYPSAEDAGVGCFNLTELK